MLRNAAIITTALFMSMATAAEQTIVPSIDIKSEVHYNALPGKDLSSKRIFIQFEGSPKVSLIVREKLKSRGFVVVDKEEDAQESFKLNGMILISGAGKQEVRARLGEVLESAVAIGDPSAPDYTRQNVDLLQIGVSAAYAGIASTLSVTDMVRWIGQKTGIAGRFNELVTGDPRGYCFGEACSKFTTTAIMNVTGSGGHWWIKESAVESKVVLDILIADILEGCMKPFYDLQKK